MVWILLNNVDSAIWPSINTDCRISLQYFMPGASFKPCYIVGITEITSYVGILNVSVHFPINRNTFMYHMSHV